MYTSSVAWLGTAVTLRVALWPTRALCLCANGLSPSYSNLHTLAGNSESVPRQARMLAGWCCMRVINALAPLPCCCFERSLHRLSSRLAVLSLVWPIRAGNAACSSNELDHESAPGTAWDSPPMPCPVSCIERQASTSHLVRRMLVESSGLHNVAGQTARRTPLPATHAFLSRLVLCHSVRLRKCAENSNVGTMPTVTCFA